LKREVLEGEKAESARRMVSRAANRALRASAEKESEETNGCADATDAPSAAEALS